MRGFNGVAWDFRAEIIKGLNERFRGNQGLRGRFEKSLERFRGYFWEFQDAALGLN